jgi:hypothetical protein
MLPGLSRLFKASASGDLFAKEIPEFVVQAVL